MCGELVTLIFVVLAGVILGLEGIFGWDIRKHFGKTFVKVLFILIGVATLLHILSRDYYLPFLGPSAYPCGSLIEKEPANADKEVLLHTSPLSSVIYWAAESNTEVQKNPIMAYAANTNAGVTKSDARGKTIFKVRTPASYKVASGRELKPHIHYRVCLGQGMLGRVQTVYLD